METVIQPMMTRMAMVPFFVLAAFNRDFRTALWILVVAGLDTRWGWTGPIPLWLHLVGILVFALGFALKDTIANLLSGIMILLYRPYDIGNFVNVAGVSGTVSAMTLVSTTLTLPDNQTVVIPNNSIWGGIITNVTVSPTRRVDLVFGIGYGDDIDKASSVLERVVREHPMVLKDPEPVIKVHELADSSVNFVVRPWAETENYWQVYWDLTRQVKQAFDAEGITIPFPQRDVHVYRETPES